MSDTFLIKGSKLLQGQIDVSGAKNHALKMFPAALLSEQPCKLKGVPDILDTHLMADIITALGGDVVIEGNDITISSQNLTTSALSEDLVKKMRASFLFIIPLLYRFGEIAFPSPGGDSIGRRPIDMTLDFLKQMGARVVKDTEAYHITSQGLQGINFTFKWVSHTGTEALVMAAVLAKGRTVIKNAAMEPEVEALCDYLNSVGAKIQGAGTTNIIIDGVDKLSGGECQIIPDRIEAGTFVILGALAGNSLVVNNINPGHLDVLWKYFDLMGINYTLEENKVIVSKTTSIKPQQVKTHEYPGFITDLQPPMTLLLTQAEGLSMMHETIYDGRLFYTDLLNEMGANIIMADPHRVIIQGPTKLYGKKISSPDIRAGITLVVAALIAENESKIGNIYHIDRGYENIEQRLKGIGADITRIHN